jgi:tetratricopeptide (TPR) repeat protein
MRRLKLAVMAVLTFGASVSAWTQDSVPKPTKPIAQLEAQAASEPNNPRLLHQLGAAYFYQARDGDRPMVDKAIANLERSIALAPEDVAARRSLGVAYLTKLAYLPRQSPPQEMMAAVQQAISAFERVLERYPTDPTALSLHGSALTIVAGFRQSQEMFAKGLEEMNRTVKENPNTLAPYLNRGFALLNLPSGIRDSKTAEADLKAILKDLPHGYNERAQAALRVLLGDLYLEMKDTSRATAEYETAAKLSAPAAAEARSRLESFKQGQSVEKAIARYRQNVNDCAMCHASR